ncbi:MAG: lipid-binding SYLF domain-containing protein [Woeseiaceae bacterium]|nr:lipid-binding SYLF domain-containing protein [Woeseiaceae bacterium]
MISHKIWALVIAAVFASGCSVFSTSAQSIDLGVDEAVEIFRKDIDGSEIFLDQAAGYLVFPRALRAGLGVGAETGEGVLRIGGETVDYYRITSGSLGLQAGAQARSIIICFMTQNALDRFRNSNGWRVGVDGSIALIDMGAGKTIDSQNVRDPIVGFIFNSSGLMANLTLEGTKFARITR